jgi:hypothetical protein
MVERVKGSVGDRLRLRVTALAGMAALAAGVHGATAAGPQGLDVFVATHQCRVAEGLRMIAATKKDRDPFLILAWPPSSPTPGYVQCLFKPDNTEIYCEARSGGLDPELRRGPSPAGLQALARLRFDMNGSNRNFQLCIPLGKPGDLDAVAELMLTALYSGYEGVPDRPVLWTAPNAAEATAARRCAPRS